MEEQEDICGLCGQPGANKIPHPVYWPNEQRPNTRYVHDTCENEECRRAHSELTPKEVNDFLHNLN